MKDNHGNIRWIEESTAFLTRPALWFFAAIVFVAIALLVVVCGLVVLLNLPTTQWQSAFDILYKAALIAAGFVTFCTVAWRGLLSSRQLNVQQLQVDRLTDQIKLTEENNLALLLQKGAELIAETDKEAHVAAGIATLQAVASASNGKFAVEAMDLLADHLQARHGDDIGHPLAAAAISALAAGARLGRQSARELSFVEPDRFELWKPVLGVRSVNYKNGSLDYSNFRRSIEESATHYFFDGCNIPLASDIIINANYRNCSFSNCTIRYVSFRYTGHNTFEECDFSGTEIHNIERLPKDMKAKGNFFRPNHPPVAMGLITAMINWSEHFVIRERTDKDEFGF